MRRLHGILQTQIGGSQNYVSIRDAHRWLFARYREYWRHISSSPILSMHRESLYLYFATLTWILPLDRLNREEYASWKYLNNTKSPRSLRRWLTYILIFHINRSHYTWVKLEDYMLVRCVESDPQPYVNPSKRYEIRWSLNVVRIVGILLIFQSPVRSTREESRKLTTKPWLDIPWLVLYAVQMTRRLSIALLVDPKAWTGASFLRLLQWQLIATAWRLQVSIIYKNVTSKLTEFTKEVYHSLFTICSEDCRHHAYIYVSTSTECCLYSPARPSFPFSKHHQHFISPLIYLT